MIMKKWLFIKGISNNMPETKIYQQSNREIKNKKSAYKKFDYFVKETKRGYKKWLMTNARQCLKTKTTKKEGKQKINKYRKQYRKKYVWRWQTEKERIYERIQKKSIQQWVEEN